DYTDTTAESVRAAVDKALAEADSLIENAVASVDAPSFETTIGAVELAGAAANRGWGPSAFMAYVHADADVRDAGQAAEERIPKGGGGKGFRRGLCRGG